MLSIVVLFGFGAALLALSGASQAQVSDAGIRNSYHEKAAVAQLMRWYQYYENNGEISCPKSSS